MAPALPPCAAHAPPCSLFSALDRALSDFSSDRAAWAELACKNMNVELSWAKPAAEYVDIYNAIAGVA